MKLWAGPMVPGVTEKEAKKFCQANGLGYCKVMGSLVCEVPSDTAEYASILNLNKDN
jgi:hypothetical protein